MEPYIVLVAFATFLYFTIRSKFKRVIKKTEKTEKEKNEYLAAILVLTAAIVAIFWIGISGYLRETQPVRKSPPQEVVFNSPYDGSVAQVMSYLRENLTDPDSFQATTWFNVVKVPDGAPAGTTHKYVSRVKFRARNSFGGYVIYDVKFFLDARGQIVHIEDLSNNP